MIDTAVILAAGMGTRLEGAAADHPKGFLRLGELPIVEESILRLQAVGVSSVVIVTGYRSEYYDALAGHYPGAIQTVHNERFADSGSLYSLYLARKALQRPFLLLESDLIYEPQALHALVEGPEDAILLSGPTGAGDEVYVETRSGYLVSMSKDRASLGTEPTGELVGISRISQELFELIVDYSEQAFRTTLAVDYETDGLVAAGRKRPIACPVVSDLLWAEIDDTSHLKRARERVYPFLPLVR